MTCIEIKEVLIDFINEDLTQEEMTFVATHIRECPDCYQELQIIQEMISFCQEPIEYQECYVEEFVYQVRCRIEKQNRMKNLVRFVPVVTIPLVIAVFLLFRPSRREHIPIYIDNETRVMVDSLSDQEFDQLIEKIKQVNFVEE
ncbi:MAG TPA: zf-HC2 domain-containing protein [bacterium (Candidatus Stahlbacteria)]|nr:zf-HC2 domain-containing protein [Candidatus Stahlbacteria bacterium]